MSEDVNSRGIMFALKEKISSERREEIEEDLWKTQDYGGFCIGINYEGTIIYFDDRADTHYGLIFGSFKANGSDVKKLEEACEKYGLELDWDYSKTYVCNWYNGGDSDMDLLELEEFKEVCKNDGIH